MNNCVDIGIIQTVPHGVLAQNSGNLIVFKIDTIQQSFSEVIKYECPDCCNGAALSPNGTHIVATCDSNRVLLFSLSLKKSVYKLDLIHTIKLEELFGSRVDEAQYCCWSNDSKIFAVSGEGGYLIWYNLEDLTTPKRIFRVPESLYRVSFSTNDTELAVVGRKACYIFDTSENASPSDKPQVQRLYEDYRTLKGKPKYLFCSGMSFSENKLFVATSGGIIEYKSNRSSLPSLFSLCCKKIEESSITKQELLQLVSQEIADAIFPAEDLIFFILPTTEETEKEIEMEPNVKLSPLG